MSKKIQHSGPKLKDRLVIAKEIAFEAGEVLLRYSKKISKLVVNHKKSQGVFTMADTASEKIVIKALKKHFPGEQIMAEESFFETYGTGDSAAQLEARYRSYQELPYQWVIDPLDGTNNYLNGLDYYAVCIGLLRFGEPILGVVYRPTTGECFSAFQGGGAFKDRLPSSSLSLRKARPKQKIYAPANKKTMRDSILVTGFATEKGESIESEFLFFQNVYKSTRAIRRMGSAALDLVYVGEGIFDGFWELGLAPWDVAAAGSFCLEAGVKITDFQGEAFSPFNKSILAARAPLHGKLQEYFE